VSWLSPQGWSLWNPIAQSLPAIARGPRVTPAGSRRDSRGFRQAELRPAGAGGAPEAIQAKCVVPRPDARRPWAEVVAWLERDGLDASRVWRHRQQQVDVRAPSVTFDERLFSRGAHGIS